MASEREAGRPARGPRLVRRPVHGVLLLDKPPGFSSHDALRRAAALLRAEKSGHTGTLDPLATGLLPLCFGAATKFSQAGLDADKTYRAVLQLGQRTEGGDGEGRVIEQREVRVDTAALRAACERFTGEIAQLPPLHSAVKVDGRPLYAYARAGQAVERTPRRVTIHDIALRAFEGTRAEIDVRCSKGTYIRSLADDLGELLGCGAHLAGLRRLAGGAFGVEDAVTLDALAAMDEPRRLACLLPVDALLADAPVVRLDAEQAGRFLSGLRRRVALPDAPQVRVYGPEPRAFLGSAHVTAGELIPDRLLSPLEVRQMAQQAGWMSGTEPPDPAAPERADASNSALVREAT